MREAEVLILDEPTAALDTRCDCEVFRWFKELCEKADGDSYLTSLSSMRMAGRLPSSSSCKRAWLQAQL